ncbi:MAG: flagellar basal body protein, partial [Chlorobiota bacterium]
MSFRALHIAQSALLAHQAALEVASGNIANATTPGYARRRAQLSPIVPEPGHVGTGVRISSVESFRSHHLDAHLRSLQARWGWAEMGVQLLQRLEAVLGEPSETGVSALLQRFFAAVQ